MQMACHFTRFRLPGLLTLALALTACAMHAATGSNAMQQGVLPQVVSGLGPALARGPLPFRGDKSRVERVLYSFKGGRDGSEPEPELIAVGDTLYGTTFEGGDPSCPIVFYGSVGCGTIFQIDTSGSDYSVLYRFKTADSGTFPTLGVIDVNSTLYGTAFYSGGDGSKCGSYLDGCGTLYKIDPTGKKFKVLHDFAGGDDGGGPYANLVDAGNGTLYGATNFGGAGCASGGCGTVYAFDLNSRAESIVYPFKGGTDGSDPIGVTESKGFVYGVTLIGGSSAICSAGSYSIGCGTVFKIDPGSGKESVLYRFKGGKDGAFPLSVLSINGDLYGTTQDGGGSACAGSGYTGCGTIFKVSATSGSEKVLYRFKAGTDGAHPNQLIANINGTLYGTTSSGGYGCVGSGCGTIFKIDTSGKRYDVVYRFLAGKDGAFPSNGVMAVNGKLYGTTFEGGRGCKGFGCGTVFEATP
jgi:uncharacterized repeat protein (TIGR03803 family)